MFKITTNFFAKFINWKLNFSLLILAFLIFVSSGQIFGPYFFFGFGKWFSLFFLLVYLILPIFHFQKLAQKSNSKSNSQTELKNKDQENWTESGFKNSENDEKKSELNNYESFVNKFKKLENYQNLVQFWLISVVFFTYFGRMSGFELNILGFNLISFWLFLPFLIFTFSVNYFLFKSRSVPEFLLTIFVFITTLLNFSFVEFLQIDRTDKRFFIDNSVDFIFSLPIWVWFMISILSIFTLTLINLNIQIKNEVEKNFEKVKFGNFWKKHLLILLIIIASFLFSYNLSFAYWYKSLIFVIIWHFLFQVNLAKFQNKTKVQNLLVFSYHLLLTIIVFVVAFWLN